MDLNGTFGGKVEFYFSEKIKANTGSITVKKCPATGASPMTALPGFRFRATASWLGASRCSFVGCSGGDKFSIKAIRLAIIKYTGTLTYKFLCRVSKKFGHFFKEKGKSVRCCGKKRVPRR